MTLGDTSADCVPYARARGEDMGFTCHYVSLVGRYEPEAMKTAPIVHAFRLKALGLKPADKLLLRSDVFA